MPYFAGQQIDPAHVAVARRQFEKAREKQIDQNSTAFLSARALKALEWLGVDTIDDAKQLKYSQMLRPPNCGRGTSAELFLWANGITEP